jgi:hypothetical protein
MMNIFPLVFGIVLALLSIAVLHLCRIAQERGTWIVSAVAIASFYIVFALEHQNAIIGHSIIAFGFALLALIGARFSPWLIVLSIIGHGSFDLLIDVLMYDPSPIWWGPFCAGVDLTFGFWLAYLISQNRLKKTDHHSQNH